MIVFERFVDGIRYIPYRAASRGGAYGVAAPALTHAEKKEARHLIAAHSAEELLYYVQRGYSVRMVAEGRTDERLIKAENINVRFVPPY